MTGNGSRNPQGVHVRPARPVLEEGLYYARYLDMAAEGFFRLLLGRRADQILAVAYLETEHSHSYQNVLFAESHGEVVGMACGFSAAAHAAFSDQPLKKAAGGITMRMRIGEFVFAPMMRLLETIAAGDYYVLAIAADGQCRGLGIGSALMDSMERRARSSGSNRLALDVAGSNTLARNWYARRGMHVESRWPRRFRIPKLTIYRMVKSLRNDVAGRASMPD